LVKWVLHHGLGGVIRNHILWHKDTKNNVLGEKYMKNYWLEEG